MAEKRSIAESDRQAIRLYLAALKAEKQIAHNTALAYERDLLVVAATLHEQGKSLVNADTSALRKGLPRWTSGQAATSQARRISAVKGFMSFALAEGWRNSDAGRALERPKLPEALPKSLDEEEIGRMIATAKADEDAQGARLLAILEILYATGLRVSELTHLHLAPFNRRRRSMIVTGKGGKERMVVLTDAALDAIAAWIGYRDRQAANIGSPYLFPATDAKKPVSRQQVYTMLRRLAVKAGVDPAKVSPHVLRHSFATHMLNRGADLRSLQMLLGHADIGTTEIYTRTRDDRLSGLVRDTHPLADKS